MIRRVGNWPATPEFSALAERLAESLASRMLDTIWAGVERFAVVGFHTVDPSDEPLQLERTLNQQLYVCMQKVMDFDLPVSLIHEVYEFASTRSRRGRPPQPDFGFVLNAHRAVIWPVEAKVLRSPADIGEYVDELRKNFLSCTYAPFTGEGAMLGYLRSGSRDETFRNIGVAVPCTLLPAPGNPPRDHMTSEHTRTVPAGKSYRTLLRCHHLLVPIAL